VKELPRLYPLPFDLRDRVSPEQLIPEAALTDPFGEGKRALEIASMLRVTEGEAAGRFFGDVLCEWQRRLIVALYGHRDEEGRRIIQNVTLLTGRKSGKTALLSALLLLELIIIAEPRGQVLCLASQRDQSRLIFKNVMAMINQDSLLRKRFKISDYLHRILDVKTHGELKALSTEAGGVIGTGPSSFVVDELHQVALLGEKGLDLVHGLESGMLARREPLRAFITTAPVRVAGTAYTEVISYARGVLSGEIDDRRTLALLYEVPEGVDYQNPDNWHYSNPSLGRTITLEALKDRYRVAEQRGPEALAEFWSQNINVEPRSRDELPTQFNMKRWGELAEQFTLDELIESSPGVAFGIDVGGSDDLTALVAIGLPSRPGAPFRMWSHFWVSKAGFEKLRNTTPATTFLARDEITVVESPGLDVAEVVEIIINSHVDHGKLVAVGADPWGLTSPARDIEIATGIEVAGVKQGAAITPFLIDFMRAIDGGAFRHSDNQCLSWCMENVRLRETGASALVMMKPDGGGNASPRKIDGAIAAVCGWAVRDRAPVVDVSAMIA
jgi:phage terminase large subunit-like protein